MDKIEMISFSILLDEVAEVRQLLENIVSLDKTVYPELSIGILPFVSSLCDGILKGTSKNLSNGHQNMR
ncbi:hypothetical protein [Streptococcus mitis]|uniref:hypothetical protein n=1 Tax=Streptococcus mitis TaxID=28037 RepID=UPI001CBC23B5|nr:hypothetical protein [Streptococcus mitis]MBZ2107928.1 hypothetical protein [Streptococcus mitis]